MRIIDALIDYIESNTDFVVTDVDQFYLDESNGIMIMQTPSDAEETRYFDGSRSGTFSFDILSKNLNSQTAVAQLFELESLLDLPNGVDFDEGIFFIKSSVVKTATLIEQTEKNGKIYSSGFALQYYL